MQVLRSHSLYPEFNPWRRLHEEFQYLTSIALCLEAHLPNLQLYVSKTSSDGPCEESAGVAPVLPFGCELARSRKRFASAACSAAAGVDSVHHEDRDRCPAWQEQFHHTADENQKQWRYQKWTQPFMCPKTAESQVEQGCQKSYHDSKRQAGCVNTKHERILACMAKRMDRSRVIFLGTGCAEPSPYRTGTGILLQTAHDAYLMIDAGENTMGQLVRIFGHEGAHHVVSDQTKFQS